MRGGGEKFGRRFLKVGVLAPAPTYSQLVPGDTDGSKLSDIQKIQFFELLPETFGTGMVLASQPQTLTLEEAGTFFDQKTLAEFEGL